MKAKDVNTWIEETEAKYHNKYSHLREDNSKEGNRIHEIIRCSSLVKENRGGALPTVFLASQAGHMRAEGEGRPGHTAGHPQTQRGPTRPRGRARPPRGRRATGGPCRGTPVRGGGLGRGLGLGLWEGYNRRMLKSLLQRRSRSKKISK